MSMMKHRALQYAEAGWRVLPIFSVDRAGDLLVCGCGNPYCPAPGKHPLVSTGKGLDGATSDAVVVGSWWDQWPNANIAVAMGGDRVCIDLDFGDETDGEVELEGWAAANGVDLGTPLRAQTGSGARHLVYRVPGGTEGWKNANGWLPSVDIKVGGGYILVDPSLHVSGGNYQWLEGVGPAPVLKEEHDIPAALRQHLLVARGTPGKGGVGGGPTYDYREACKSGPRAGVRDAFFNSRAFELRKSGVEYEEAKKDIRRLWELCEQPPGNEWPWDEVVKKLDRVWKEVEADPLPQWNPYAASDGKPVNTGIGPPEKKDTDIGNSQRFADEHGDDAKYTNEAGWFVWDGRLWAGDEMGRPVELAKKTASGIFVQAAMETDPVIRDRLLAWAKLSEGRQRVDAMIYLARSDPRIVASVLDFDFDPWLLTCANGTLDLRTGELREHRRSDFITKMTPVEYDPQAYSERFQRFLESITEGDEDLVAYLRRAAGYSLTGSTREEVFFIVYGPQASGKSTFVDGLLTIVGDMGMMTQPETIMQMGRDSRAPRDELAAMLGKRIVATVEMPETGSFAASLVKQMTGGDKIQARQLYKTRFEFQPQFKLWIATNHMVEATDDALWRRIKRVPFPRTIPLRERDMSLKEALKDPGSEEARAMFAWAVEGCKQWLQMGLGTSRVVEEDTIEAREEVDWFTAFLNECTVEGAHARSDEIYEVYTVWCGREGRKHVVTRQMLSKKMKQKFGSVRIEGKMAYPGVQAINGTGNLYGM